MTRPAARVRAGAVAGWWVPLGVVAAVCCLAAYPQYSDVTVAPLSAFVAMRRAILAAGVLAIAVLTLSGPLWRHSGRRARGVAAGAALILFSTLLGVLILSTGEVAARAVSADPDAVTIVSWNTNQQDVSVGTIERLVSSTHPDVIVLPEYFGNLTGGLRFGQDGEYRAYSWDSSAATAFVRKRLGVYRVDTSGVPPWAGFVLRPTLATSPMIVVTHLQRAGLVDARLWRRHLGWSAAACNGPDVIEVGDFNAAPENLPADGRFGRCRDAAATLGLQADATWPTALPMGLGAQIDHAFLGSEWRPTRFEVGAGVDRAGSDHRPIVVTISRTGR